MDKKESCQEYVKNYYPLGSDRLLIEYLAEKIDQLTERVDRLSCYQELIKSGATIRRAEPGEEGGFYIKGKKLTDEELHECLFLGPGIEDKDDDEYMFVGPYGEGVIF